MRTGIALKFGKTRGRPKTVEPSCSKGTAELEAIAKEQCNEFTAIGQLLRQMRSEITTFELMERGRQDEILLDGIKDIRALQKKLKVMANEDNKECGKLKKTFVNLIAGKEKLRQNVMILESRVNKMEKDVIQPKH